LTSRLKMILGSMEPFVLRALKGVGPATASLILAVYAPESVIFFGDEVFRWLCWEETSRLGHGWNRKISYSMKEYQMLHELSRPVLDRLKVQAIELEKVGYVLGKERAELDDNHSTDERTAKKRTIEEDSVKPTSKRGRK